MANVLDRASLAIVAGMTVLTAALYPRLPDRVPIHFDIHGTPDWYASRPVGAAILPVTVLLLLPFVRWSGQRLPRAAKERLDRSPTAAVVLFVVALMAALQLVILRTALAPHKPAGGLIVAILALSWLVLGLVMPRVRRNPFIGVRTPWTLASDEVWARTHRFAGLTFVASSVLGLLLSAAFGTAPAMTVLILGALAPVVYSWRIAKRSPG